MNKVMFAAFISAALFFVSCKKGDDSISVAVSADYPPFTYKDDKNPKKLIGFEIDLFNEIGKRLKKSVSYQDMPFDSVFSVLEEKKVLASIANITVTDKRQEKVDFSIPYLSTGYALVVKDPNIKAFEDLDSKSVGVEQGTSYEDLVQNEIVGLMPSLKVEPVQKISDLIAKLKGGFVDAIFTGKAEAIALSKADKNLHVVNLALKDENNFAIAFPKGSDLKKEVDLVLSEIIKDGTLDQLKANWSIE